MPPKNAGSAGNKTVQNKNPPKIMALVLFEGRLGLGNLPPNIIFSFPLYQLVK